VGDGNAVEIQIRTEQMQHEAEYGIASHIIYDEISKKNKKKPPRQNKITRDMCWIEDIIEWQKQTKDGNDFLSHVKNHLIQERIFVFTPKGEVVELPKEATPIDFAYAIHSDIGDHASGAKINKKMSSLDTKLNNGDMVEIIVNKNSRPNKKWLDFVKTNDAKRGVRVYFLNLKN